MPSIETEVDALLALDALARVTEAGQLIEEYRQAMAVVGQIRSEAVAELKEGGMSVAQIADHLKITRQQVNRLKNAVGSASSSTGERPRR